MRRASDYCLLFSSCFLRHSLHKFYFLSAQPGFGFQDFIVFSFPPRSGFAPHVTYLCLFFFMYPGGFIFISVDSSIILFAVNGT